MQKNVYGSAIPQDSYFVDNREKQRISMGADTELRSKAVRLQIEAEKYGYGYQHEWCGVPVIRLPDDIVLLQEIIWTLRPSFIIETGIARGGGLILSASLMTMANCQPKVLGLDIQILDHTKEAISSSPFADSISTWEGDSSGEGAIRITTAFIANIKGSRPGVLFLDSDHSHSHVLRELQALAPLLPVGSIVIVADTLIEEMPTGHYENRPWDRGNNPLTAVREFIERNQDFIECERWTRRGLVTELRGGVIEKVAG